MVGTKQTSFTMKQEYRTWYEENGQDPQLNNNTGIGEK